MATKNAGKKSGSRKAAPPVPEYDDEDLVDPVEPPEPPEPERDDDESEEAYLTRCLEDTAKAVAAYCHPGVRKDRALKRLKSVQIDALAALVEEDGA